MKAIQLHFTGGIKTKLYEGAKEDSMFSSVQKFEKVIDTTRRIDMVRVFRYDCYLQHLKFLDPKGQTILDLNWYDHHEHGEWQDIKVPDGQEIIGLYCNTD